MHTIILLSIINLEMLATMKGIFLESHHSYCIIHLSKNLIIDVLDREATRVFWATMRAHIELEFNECV